MNHVAFPSPSRAPARPAVLLAVAVLLCAVNLVARFPGETNPDSDDQYRQLVTGRYNDWHPPAMARLWSVLHVFGDGAGPMFSFHVVLYWIGFGLVAVALVRQGRPAAAWCAMAVGALPPLLMLNINIAKDIGLGVALLCSFGLGFALRRRDGTVPVTASIVTTLLVAYAALVRGNAVFAVGPLLVYAWSNPTVRARPARPIASTVAISVAVAFVLIPVSALVNRHLLRAAPGGAIESLQFFDVAGTARLAHDDRLFGAQAPTEADLRRCYSPIMWDTLPQRCPALWAGVSGPVLGGQGDSASQPPLSALWVAAIRAHPLAYLAHRLLGFNAALYLYVPPHHTEYVRKIDTAGNRSTRWSARLLDAIRYNWLTAPATMLALACALLWFTGRTPGLAVIERRGAIALLASSILYTASFLPFGVATDQRYFFWPTIATLLAAVLLAPSVRSSFREQRWRTGAMFVPVAIVLALIAVARLRDDASLLLA